MIRSFADKRTAAIFVGRAVKGIPGEIQGRARTKLQILDAAKTLEDLSVPPGNRLESLSGNLKGFWSVRINQQWRLVFRWENGRTTEVKITDYH